MCRVQKWLCCFSLFHFALISRCCESSARFHSQNAACSQSSNLAGTLILNSNVPLLAQNISVCLFKGQMQTHLNSGLTLSRNQCRVSDLELQARVCYFYCGSLNIGWWRKKELHLKPPDALFHTLSQRWASTCLGRRCWVWSNPPILRSSDPPRGVSWIPSTIQPAE